MTGFSRVLGATGLAGVDQDGNPVGDLTGSYPGPIVKGLQTYPIDPRTPANGETLVFNGGEWIPTPSPTNVTFFQGVWDANTNTPDITNFPGLADGYLWIVSVAGNTNLSGITDWLVGDYALYSAGNWYKLSNKAFGWGLTGNDGTNPNINYVGTSDTHDFSLRTNEEEVLRLFYGKGAYISGSLTVDTNLITLGNITGSNAKLIGDLAVCGGDITSNSSIFNLLNGVTTRINVGNSTVCNWISGSTKFPQGLSGSLTKLTDGTSAFIEGIGILISSASNGAVTFTMSNTGSAGVYGSSSQIPVFNTDVQGRVTSVSNTSVQITESQVTNLLTDLTSSYNSVSNLSSSLASEKANKTTSIIAGTGLTGGGDLSANRTINLSNTGSAGTYGSSTTIPVFTTDAQGRVTSVSNTSAALDANQITTGILSVTRGGTGLGTAPTNGQLLIGNGTGFTETTLTPGTGILITNGAGSITTSINNSVVATISGSTFTGIVKFNAGLSGSLTQLTDGSSYIIANNNMSVTSASNGAITLKATPSGSDAYVQFNDGGTTFGANSGLAYNKTTQALTGTIIRATNGFSGSLTKLTDGTSYLTNGQNISITSASNGSVNVTFATSPTPLANDVLLYNGTSWAPSSIVSTLQTSYQTVLASEAIAAGDVVYIVNSGGSGANPTVARAQANSLATVHGVLGLASGSIAKNATGVVQTYGQLVGPVDTHLFGQGDPLYVSATTPGGVTNVKPVGPNYTFQIGIVTRQGQPQNVTTGIIFVSPIMQTDTQNISDIVLATPIEHDSLVYDSVTSTWKNKQPLWAPETQTALTVAAGQSILASDFFNVIYLPIKTAGGANVTLSLTAPVANLTKTTADYGRELWLYNADNNRSISIPSGGTVKLDTSALVGGNFVMTPGTIIRLLWTGLGGNGAWIQTAKAVTVA